MNHRVNAWSFPRGIGACLALSLSLALPDAIAQTNWALIGWNNLGMHCMDSDFSVFSILPPYNTIHAQLINNQGRLVTNTAGIGVTSPPTAAAILRATSAPASKCKT